MLKAFDNPKLCCSSSWTPSYTWFQTTEFSLFSEKCIDYFEIFFIFARLLKISSSLAQLLRASDPPKAEGSLGKEKESKTESSLAQLVRASDC